MNTNYQLPIKNNFLRTYDENVTLLKDAFN